MSTNSLKKMNLSCGCQHFLSTDRQLDEYEVRFGIQVVLPGFVYNSEIPFLSCLFVRQDLVKFSLFKVVAISVVNTKRNFSFHHNFFQKPLEFRVFSADSVRFIPKDLRPTEAITLSRTKCFRLRIISRIHPPTAIVSMFSIAPMISKRIGIIRSKTNHVGHHGLSKYRLTAPL